MLIQFNSNLPQDWAHIRYKIYRNSNDLKLMGGYRNSQLLSVVQIDFHYKNTLTGKDA